VTSLVIGNGESRKDFTLTNFSNNYKLIGCNAVHRDIEVDHLVCCDRRMVEESIHSENTLNTKIYARHDWFKYYRKIKKDKRIYQVPELPYIGNLKQDQPIHWGSGTYAVLLAATLSQRVCLIGFDLYPVSEKVNNLYKNTNNYSKAAANPVDYSFWEYQIGKVFQHFPNNEFVVLNTPDWKMPKVWNRPNVKFEVLATKNLTFA